MNTQPEKKNSEATRSKTDTGMTEETRRELLSKLKKAAIVAPVATVLMLSANDAYGE